MEARHECRAHVGAIQRMKPLIAVIGGSLADADETAWAETVGRLLAERGAVLLCGGYGGVMEAAASLVDIPRATNPERAVTWALEQAGVARQ